MQRYDVFPIGIGGGKTIQAEVQLLGGEEDVASRLLNLDDLSVAIEGIARSLMPAFDAIKPDKAIVEMGIQLSVKEGKLAALLVSGQATASLKLSLEWGSEKAKD